MSGDETGKVGLGRGDLISGVSVGVEGGPVAGKEGVNASKSESVVTLAAVEVGVSDTGGDGGMRLTASRLSEAVTIEGVISEAGVNAVSTVGEKVGPVGVDFCTGTSELLSADGTDRQPAAAVQMSSRAATNQRFND